MQVKRSGLCQLRAVSYCHVPMPCERSVSQYIIQWTCLSHAGRYVTGSKNHHSTIFITCVLLLPPHQHQQMSFWKRTFVFDRFLLIAKRQVVEQYVHFYVFVFKYGHVIGVNHDLNKIAYSVRTCSVLPIAS